MKHTWSVTYLLVLIFIITQIVGLSLINLSIEGVGVNEDGEKVIENMEGISSIQPETEGVESLAYILFAILVGTVIIMILVKFKAVNIWTIWFFLAVSISVAISLGVMIAKMFDIPLDPNGFVIGGVIAAVLALIKMYKRNVVIHNLTEILMYSGIGIILYTIFNVFYASLMLIAISLYDMWAVWRSKHMVKMAQFQTESKLFAGLMIPYTGKKIHKKMEHKKKSGTQVSGKVLHKEPESKTAILGGGDVAFPLVFSGAVLQSLILDGISQNIALLMTFIISITTAIALLYLFYIAQKDKFYPAMPIVSAGCFIGLGIVWILKMVI